MRCRYCGRTRSKALRQLLPGGDIEELIPAEVPSRLKAYLVVAVPGVRDPWATAAQLETLPGVEQADPDLPRYLAANPADVPTALPGPTRPKTWESSGGRSEWDEPRFLRNWLASSPWLKNLNPLNPADLQQIRRWNQRAIGYEAQPVANLLGADGVRALAGLRLAQLDTGYTDHSKVRDGYNLNADYDAIDDDDDARDPLQTGLFKFPGHGTRTGGLLIGTATSHVAARHEGNFGLLRELSAGEATAQTRVAPFRVAKSVILLGSVKRVARAVQLALDHGFQVLTMSMCTLGNDVFEDLARTVYDLREHLAQYGQEATNPFSVRLRLNRARAGHFKEGLFPENVFFNTSSIGLFDEDIEEIARSGGLIGISLDSRILGYQNLLTRQPLGPDHDFDYFSREDFASYFPDLSQTLPRLTEEEEEALPPGVELMPGTIGDELLGQASQRTRELYLCCLNVLHIVAVIQAMQPPGGRSAWDFVCLGSDYDGLIASIKAARTVDLLPSFRQELLAFFPKAEKAYHQAHGTVGDLLPRPNGTLALESALDALFYGNGQQFLKDWWG